MLLDGSSGDNGYLFPVQRSQETMKSGRHLSVRAFPTLSDMVHLDLFLCLATDASGFSMPGADAETNQSSHDTHVLLALSLKDLPVFGPVSVKREANFAVCLASQSFAEEREAQPLPERRNTWGTDILYCCASVFACENFRIYWRRGMSGSRSHGCAGGGWWSWRSSRWIWPVCSDVRPCVRGRPAGVR